MWTVFFFKETHGFEPLMQIIWWTVCRPLLWMHRCICCHTTRLSLVHGVLHHPSFVQ